MSCSGGGGGGVGGGLSGKEDIFKPSVLVRMTHLSVGFPEL